jgi:hypothetical protein
MTLPKTTLVQWAVLAAIVAQGGFAQAAAVAVDAFIRHAR